MKYYKDKDGNVYAFADDGSEDYFIQPDFELLDEAGLAVARAAQAAANAPTPAEVLATANAQRDLLLATAALYVAPLQDAVDLGSATAADTANLTLWKQYRVDVNRVSEQTGFPATIDWPTAPDQWGG